MSDIDILSELVKNQLHDVPSQHRLKISDMMRIADRVSSSVFNPSLCSVWLSYISNKNRPEKGVCVNFFFKGRKVLLHRLLYVNYVSVDIDSSYYLKRKCKNHECVNVSHYYSVKYEGDYKIMKRPPYTPKQKQNVKRTQPTLSISQHTNTYGATSASADYEVNKCIPSFNLLFT